MPPFLSKLQFLCLQVISYVLIDLPLLPWRVCCIFRRGSPKSYMITPSNGPRGFSRAALNAVRYTDPACSGHRATLLCAVRPHLPVPYSRETVPGGDGNPIRLDWFLSSHETPAGLMIMLPGLASWSGTNYIEKVVWDLHARHFHCCVFNSRGMGDTPLEKPQLMSAAWTQDLRHIFQHGVLSRAALRERFGGNVPTFGVGFSLGGVIFAKYAGENGRDGVEVPLDGLLLVNSPLDALESNRIMASGLQRLAYQPNMTSGLVKYVRAHQNVLKDLPNLSPWVRERFETGHCEDVFARIHTVDDFDFYINAPSNGFANNVAYYKAITPLGWLPYCPVPVLCICAQDDPVCGAPPAEQLEHIMEKNANVSLLVLPYGGHLGYIKSAGDEWKGEPTMMSETISTACITFTTPPTAS